jgi:hypothetical protein
MNEEENKIKGGVIIIGSLFWEDKDNAIQEKESIYLAEKRKEWRETYLDLDKKEICKLPIRYGRCSSSRKCTYTMVFSREALDKDSSGLVFPYKSEIDFSNYLHFERQAKILADVEGISKNNDNRLRKTWGCIGIYIKPNSVHSATIINHWKSLILTDSNYKTAPKYYNPEVPLIDSDYCLVSDVQINTEIDFLFFTYIRVEHRELDNDRKPIRKYPMPQEIAEEINRSNYKTYFEENKKSGITTFQDVDINPLVK